MKNFPMFLKMDDRRVVIVGGGEQAAQKARLILKTEAAITLVADTLDPELADLVASGRAQHQRHLSTDVFEDAALAFIGTGCPAIDVCAHALAKSARCLVNVVDKPELCEATTPALVDRDPIVVAIGSEGTSPVLTRDIKTRLETMLPQNLGGLAALAGRLRGAVDQNVPRAKRRPLWAWVFKGAPRALWTRGAEKEAAAQIKAAIAKGEAPQDAGGTGLISLVGAGPGARDLLTLRAVERLQEADVIFYDRLVDEDVLELARRDAERVFVGKHVGASTWPQERINARIVAEAKKGLRVVRLKSGDPGVFGRATEELDAARDAGIEAEIVPGVTAASAAGAAFGQSLTARGVSDTLVLSTGMSQPGAALPDTTRFSAPGTTTALYMSVGQAPRIQADLVSRGLPMGAPVQIAVDVSKPTERLLQGTLGGLPGLLEAEQVRGGAIILVTWPHDMAQVPSARPKMAVV